MDKNKDVKDMVICSFCRNITHKKNVVRKPISNKLSHAIHFVDPRISTIKDGNGDHCPACDALHAVGLRNL